MPGAARGEKQAAVLWQILADADWNTVGRHGGLDAGKEKIHQGNEETALTGKVGTDYGKSREYMIWTDYEQFTADTKLSFEGMEEED